MRISLFRERPNIALLCVPSFLHSRSLAHSRSCVLACCCSYRSIESNRVVLHRIVLDLPSSRVFRVSLCVCGVCRCVSSLTALCARLYTLLDSSDSIRIRIARCFIWRSTYHVNLVSTAMLEHQCQQHYYRHFLLHPPRLTMLHHRLRHQACVPFVATHPNKLLALQLGSARNASNP